MRRDGDHGQHDGEHEVGAASTTRERITAAIAAILTAGARAGTLRGDVDPDDVTAMMLGVFLSTAMTTTPEKVGRMLDLVADSLRRRPRTETVHLG